MIPEPIPDDLLNPAPPSEALRREIFEQQKRSRYVQVARPDGSSFQVLIRPPRNGQEKSPVVLWIHGGAYWTGSSDWIFNNMAREVADKCLTVAPDYQLGPYPGPIRDCLTTLEWIVGNSEALGGDLRQLIIGGDSAGGALAIAVCLYARDHSGPKIALQIPLYPMMDYRMITPSSRNNTSPGWGSRDNARAWASYLQNVEGDVPVYASPALETNYHGLPPCITMAGGIEVFRDETIEYVKNLEKAGIPVEFKIFPGAYHMFDVYAPESRYAKEAHAFFNKAFDYALAHYRT